MSVRLRRLQSDYEQIRQALHGHPAVSIRGVSSNPPDRYQIEYKVRSLVETADSRIVERTEHVAEVYLTLAYPRQAPQCRMLTPVFHPNIAPHAICIGDHWAAGESLLNLIIRIGEMLAYQSYNNKSPLNGAAARWADEHTDLLPTDRRDMSPSTWIAAAGSIAADNQCRNCRAENKPLVTCVNGHRVCTDCLVACARCGREFCLMCRLESCQQCGRLICSTCGTACPQCGQTVCSEHVQPCSICGLAGCPDCTIPCSVCGAMACLEHVRQCSVCREPLCTEHAHICPICGNATCPKHADRCGVCGKNAPSLPGVHSHGPVQQPAGSGNAGLRPADAARQSAGAVLRCAHCGATVPRAEISRCSVCRKPLCTAHALVCSECGNTTCPEHTHQCSVCGRSLCLLCIVQCKQCGAQVCTSHAAQCAACRKILCEAHAYRCETCGRNFCSEHFYRAEGLCKGCALSTGH